MEGRESTWRRGLRVMTESGYACCLLLTAASMSDFAEKATSLQWGTGRG